MTVIGGIYIPDVDIISIDTASTGDPTTVVRTPFAVGGHNGPVCVIVADASSTSGNGTLTIKSGTWDGITFTEDSPTGQIAFIAVGANSTSEEFILKVSNGRYPDDDSIRGAIQIIATGGHTKAHIRVQGKTVTVS